MINYARLDDGLLSAIHTAGLPAPTCHIEYGGKFNRWGDARKSGKPYWLTIHAMNNGHMAASFGDWRTGGATTFRSWENGHAVDPAEAQCLLDELARRQQQADAENAAAHAATAKREAEIWELLPTAGESAYLDRKKVAAYKGVRFGADYFGRFVAVPMRTIDGKLTAFQRIYDDGRKYFPKSAEKKGAYHLIGTLAPDGVLYLAEGYASGATIHEATGSPVAVCFDAGNLAAVAKAIKSVYPDLQLTSGADNDQWKADELDGTGRPKGNPGVRKAYAVARTYPGTKVAIPDFTGLDTSSKPTDFNDLAALSGLDSVRRQLAQAREPKADKPSFDLILNKEGDPRPLVRNVIEVLTKDTRWTGVIGYNEFTGDAVLLKRPPYDTGAGVWEVRDLTDLDAILVAAWMQQHYRLYIQSSLANEGLQVTALDNRFHPVKEYLESIRWDGTPRIDTWAIDYFGAADNAYVRAVAGKCLIQAVARIYRPGCKADSVLVLEGMQGIGKSTFWRVMASDAWFTDSLPDMHSKDAYLHMRGKWIGELAELSAMARSEIEAIKTFITTVADAFRPPYGRRTITVPRQCVFAATTNADGYLKDTTGNRRFWPVEATKACNIQQVTADRNQLWAEAVHRFKKGEAWHLSDELEAAAAVEQHDRVEVDPWEDAILSYLEVRPALDFVTADMIFDDALNMPGFKDKNQVALKRISNILKDNGWMRTQRRKGGAPKRGFVRKPEPAAKGTGYAQKGTGYAEKAAPESAESQNVTRSPQNVTRVENNGLHENASNINAVPRVTRVTRGFIEKSNTTESNVTSDECNVDRSSILYIGTPGYTCDTGYTPRPSAPLSANARALLAYLQAEKLTGWENSRRVALGAKVPLEQIDALTAELVSHQLIAVSNGSVKLAREGKP